MGPDVALRPFQHMLQFGLQLLLPAPDATTVPQGAELQVLNCKILRETASHRNTYIDQANFIVDPDIESTGFRKAMLCKPHLAQATLGNHCK